MTNISETFIVSVDILKDDVPTVMVARRDFPKIHFVNKIVSRDALVLYNILTGVRVKPDIKDRGKAHCPNCDRDIHGVGKINFCPNCGLGLDWSFTELNTNKEENKNMEGGK